MEQPTQIRGDYTVFTTTPCLGAGFRALSGRRGRREDGVTVGRLADQGGRRMKPQEVQRQTFFFEKG